MKRLACVSLIVFVLFGVIGCAGGQQGSATSTETDTINSDNEDKTTIKTNSSAEDVKAEVTKKAFQVWKDSVNAVWGHGAIEIKNTGNVSIEIGDISISFVGKDKSILATMSMVLPVPEILQPGEVAYAGDSTTIEGLTEPSEVAGIEANIDFDKTDSKAQLLEITSLKIISSDYGGPKVTGRVSNTSSENADDIRIAIALFDDKNNLLGVYTDSPDVTLAPGKSMGFETNYPFIEVKGFASKVKKMVGIAFNWKFGL